MRACCISYYSYIKPQLLITNIFKKQVVYRTIPTSNHNFATVILGATPVVYRTIPTSNHNYNIHRKFYQALYIVLFLHQTTTIQVKVAVHYSCISYYSYIKPQLFIMNNHFKLSCISYYSYIKPQLLYNLVLIEKVVYRTIPTSNHN